MVKKKLVFFMPHSVYNRYNTCDILVLIAAFEGSVDVASIANRKRH